METKLVHSLNLRRRNSAFQMAVGLASLLCLHWSVQADRSLATLSSIQARPNTLTVDQPKAGNALTRGTVERIRWQTGRPIPTPSWRFFLSKNGVLLRELFPTPIREAATIWYADWTVPDDLVDGADYSIAVKDDSTDVSGESGSFSIGGGTNTLTVDEPKAGDALSRGAMFRIVWHTLREIPGPDWKFLLNRNGVFQRQLVPTPISDVSTIWYADWTVPDDLADGTDYSVAVKDDSTGVSGESGRFSIAGKRVKGDFDGDGLADIVFEDEAGFLGAWFLDGANMNSAKFLDPNNTGLADWRVFDTGWFDSNTTSDLAFQHTDGTLAAWFMDGIRLTSPSYFNPSHPGNGWKGVATGDANGDGKTDLIFQQTDGTLAVWYMDGINRITASFFSPLSPGDANWRVVGAADFNNDSPIDLVFQHTDGTLAVWFLDGVRLSEAAYFKPRNPGPGWRVVSTVDRNQDGKPDLLFQHADRTLAVWFMKGVEMDNAQYLSPRNPGGTWKVVGPR